ncbi:MAG TPA: AvrD family protein [Rugosimonospora sp.]|nr:AvrD family protein [Rugosimonospora sp.]
MSASTLLLGSGTSSQVGSAGSAPQHMSDATPVEVRGVHIDTILGPAADRYFGSGYRRVLPRIVGLAWHSDPHADPPGGGGSAGRRANGLAEVRYPADWSCKDGSAAAPHLSSIDALTLSVWLVEAFLANGYHVGADQASRAWLRRFVMKSGATPHVDLDHVQLHIVERERHPSQSTPDGWSSHFDCDVGNIRVRCEIEHDVDFPIRPVDPDRRRLDVPAAPHHSVGYQNHLHDIADVILDTPNRLASATVRTVDAAALTPGADHPSTYLADSTIVLAQLGQALLYRLDDLDRTQSSTLWMRRVDMWRDNPYQPLDVAVPCTTSVKRSSIVEHDGARWRVSNMAGTHGGTTVRYSVGHQLPGTGDGTR